MGIVVTTIMVLLVPFLLGGCYYMDSPSFSRMIFPWLLRLCAVAARYCMMLHSSILLLFCLRYLLVFLHQQNLSWHWTLPRSFIDWSVDSVGVNGLMAPNNNNPNKYFGLWRAHNEVNREPVVNCGGFIGWTSILLPLVSLLWGQTRWFPCPSRERPNKFQHLSHFWWWKALWKLGHDWQGTVRVIIVI